MSGNVIHYSRLTRVITPSRVEAWAGCYGSEADRFSGEQLRAMGERELDPDAVETLKVRRNVTMREMWWPSSQPAPVVIFECPVLGRRKDSRVMVISPSGLAKLVWPDGSITRPRRGRRA